MATTLIKYLTIEDFEKIFKAEKKRQFKLCYLLGFFSGLRISEIIGLKNKDKSWKIKPITAEQIDLKAHSIKIIGGKGLKDRVSVVPKQLTEEHLKLLPLKISRRTLQDHFSKLAFKTLGKKMSFHTLRHGFGNYQANEKNLPLPMLQQLMGHSRIDTTGIYTKANPIQAINRAFDNF
jgi:integrase